MPSVPDPGHPTADGRALRAARLLLLCLAFGNLLFGLIHEWGGGLRADSLPMRLGLSACLALIWGTSYVAPRVRDHIHEFTLLLAYAISFFCFWLVHVNQLHPNDTLAFLTVVVVVSLALRDRREVLAYLFFVVCGATVLGLVAGKASLNPAVFLTATYTVAAVAFVSLSHRLRAQEELERANRLLTQEVAERLAAEREAARAREEALQASRFKSRFVANMSHEIRTPMNGVLGMTELALDTELTPEQRDYLETVHSSALALLDLLSDILDLSKIEAGKLDLERIPFQLRAGLQDILRTVAHRAHEKGIELAYHVDPDVPELVVGDPGRLRQVLINLLGNAIKFTEAGEVVLHVGVATIDATAVTLRFEVADTGIGIPADKLTGIFEPFSQADGSITRRYGGTGLGLAICQQLVDMMGGRIGVESETGRGSTFRFTASLGLQSPGSGPHPPLRRADLAGLPVLVVDDNATSARILSELLRSAGMIPETAASADDGLAALRAAHARGQALRLVIVDVEMPHHDGFSFAESVRGDPSLAATPLLLLTSSGHRGDAARCRSLGVAGYLSKPVSPAVLVGVVSAILGRTSEHPATDLVTRHSLREQRRSLRVLLAEDNAVNRRLTVRLLEKRGHQIEAVADGAEAVARFESALFDVILMDVQMPLMDGLEASRRVREAERSRGTHTPIVALTAHATEEERERCLAAGMDSVVTKPIEARRLLGVLEALAPGDEAGPPPPPCAAAFDREEALRHVGGDGRLLAELALLHRTEGRKILADLRAALKIADASAVERGAHRLKGSLGILGARPAADAALAVEQAGKRGDLAAAGRLVETLEREVAALERALQHLDQGAECP